MFLLPKGIRWHEPHAGTGTKRWRRELWCFFFRAGASEKKWAHELSQPMDEWRVFLSALND
jgi:hypothetical protein